MTTLEKNNAEKTGAAFAAPTRQRVDSARLPTGLTGLRARLLGGVMSRVLGVVAPGEDYPLPAPPVFAPHAAPGAYGVVHYGIMIPDLPAPHHFLACAAILGAPAMRAFDNDLAARQHGGPRRTATLCHGTAASVDDHFTHYGFPDGMTLQEEGRLLRFGSALQLSGAYPDFRLKSERPGFAVDLQLTATGEVTWFARSPVYQHLSLLTRYRGTLMQDGAPMPVEGLCTWEYARGMSPYALVNRSLPRALKLPWDFFSYQVINLDADTQLLLVHCEVLGHPILTAAYIRVVGGGACRLAADVRLQVLSTHPEPGVAPDGRRTELPRTFCWSVRKHGHSLFEINATVDTPMLFGIGMGYVGGYRWEGSRDGRPAQGRGYMEYVDQRGLRCKVFLVRIPLRCRTMSTVGLCVK